MDGPDSSAISSKAVGIPKNIDVQKRASGSDPESYTAPYRTGNEMLV